MDRDVKDFCGNQKGEYILKDGMKEFCCRQHVQEYLKEKNDQNKKISKSDIQSKM